MKKIALGLMMAVLLSLTAFAGTTKFDSLLLTPTGIITFSEGATIANTASDTLTITETNIVLAGTIGLSAVSIGGGYGDTGVTISAAGVYQGDGAMTIEDVLTFSDGGTIDNTGADELTITETNIVLTGAVDINSGTFAGITIDGNWTAASQTCADLGTVTTADINAGTWQGTIDGTWTAAGVTCTDLGNVTTANIDGGTLAAITIDGNWTATGQTCADLGTVTTCNIDGGTLAAITIDGNWTAAGQTCADLGTVTAATFAGGTIADLGTVTTADINGGTWQGTIDGGWTAAGQTCADLGTVTTADIDAGTWQGTIDGGWTAAGQTCADLGTVTTCDIDGGTIDRIALTEEALVVYGIPINQFRQEDGIPLVHAETADTFCLNFSANVWLIYGEESLSETEISEGSFQFILPPEYVATGDVNVRIKHRVTGGGTLGTATIDVEAFEQDGEGAIGSDICTTGAAATTKASWTTTDFTVTGSGLAVGDILNIVVTSSIEETAGTAVRINLDGIAVLADIKG